MHPKKQGIESDSVRAFKKITKMITPSHSTRIKLHTAARRIQMARPFTAHLEQVTQLSSFLKLNKARHLENDATAHLQQTPQLLSLLKQNKLEDTMKTAILVKALDSSNINTIAHQKAIKMLLKYNTPITDAVLYKAGAIGDLSLIDQLYSANNDPSAGLEGAACGGRVKALQFFLTQCHLRQVVVPIEQVLVKSVEMDMLVSVHSITCTSDTCSRSRVCHARHMRFHKTRNRVCAGGSWSNEMEHVPLHMRQRALSARNL